MTIAKKEGPSETSSRSRWRVSTQEATMLESVFIQSPQPTKNTIHSVATMLNVKPRQVQVWFQNRRQRWRKESGVASAHAVSGKVADFCIDLPMSLPVGWERLLLSPAVKPGISAHPLDSITPQTANCAVEPKPVSSACADEDGEDKSFDMINSFFCAKVNNCEIPPLMGRSDSDSTSISLNCEPRDEEDDTMWVGMEWLVGSESDSIH